MLNAGPDPSTDSVNTDPQQTGATHFAIDVHPQVNASLLWQTGQCGSDANQFSDPHRITVDSQGNTWVADTGNYRVVKLDPQGNFESTFGKSGDRNGQFIQIYDLIVEPDGSLITLDPNGRKILQRFDSNGKFHEYFGVDLNTYYPRGLASDSAGNVYLVDTGLNRVLKMDPAGNLQQVWEGWLEHPEANQPVSAAIGPDGTIYIVDSVSGLIREISSNGALSWEAVNPSDSYSSSDIAVGPNNTIYISDPEERRVVIYNADQQPVGQLSADPDGRALFGKPVGIALGPDGVLVVSDSDLCRVSAFQLPESIWKD
jgi:sugar lactone lactonase YvrE